MNLRNSCVIIGSLRMDRFRRIQIHLFKGYNRATILLVITSIITRQISAQDSYKFRLGTNVTIPFSYALDEHSQHSWEIYRVGVSDPFNINGTMKPDALNPSQRDRFNISTTWGEDVLRVDLNIRNISKIDRGVYVWAVLQQAMKIESSVMTFDVFVDVILPPGRAKCDIFPSPYSFVFLEVHCRAAVGSDGGGQLVCYQNDVKTMFQSPTKMSSTHVTAVFWMDTQYDIKCCSYEANYGIGPGECNDFTRTALDKSESQIATTTETIAKMPTSTVIRTTPYHVQTTTEIFDSSQNAITNGDTVYSYHVHIIVIGVIGVLLLIAISIIILLLICPWLKTRGNARKKAGRAKQAPEEENDSML